jgi:outer membrane usher protein PapC
MAVLRMPDGKAPPFGATVKNARQQDTGIVNDGGSVYLSGIQPGDQMIVQLGSGRAMHAHASGISSNGQPEF